MPKGMTTDKTDNHPGDISGERADAVSYGTAMGAHLPPPPPADTERIVIWPHRSLGRDGTLAVIGVAAVGFAIVTAWVAAPAAWFVLFPAIIAFASLALAFWLNMRRAARLEVIDIGENTVRVMTSYLGRHELVGHFTPAWVRIDLSDAFKMEKRLVLRESGRAVSIGDCLSPPEREALAGELREKIKQARDRPV